MTQATLLHGTKRGYIPDFGASAQVELLQGAESGHIGDSRATA
eukprot:CAMPEP_0174245130 /NCGR_PEP_ID=MMETSP0417-20130205/37784_1 /TAXON_ID=242541 /ORGANISM="Mayorella sp, Strain BSH-02190019" /LENGTH=42 /DNA_ID= /DNA_START= /DNA_END= /DNA_ORIENTATION=